MPSPTTVSSSTTMIAPIPEAVVGSSGSVSSPAQPASPTTYYKGSYTEGGVTTNVIKCPEGYVFQGSNVLFETDEDKGVLKYNATNQWLKEDGTPHTTNPWTSGSLTCTRKYCDSSAIIDSDKEYDILIDDSSNSIHTVKCNDGYVFDTTNHKLGNVKCGVIPEMTNDLSKDTEVGWIADNRVIEQECESRNEQNCTDEIDYIISEDINQDYVAPGPGVKKLRCTWVPSINTDSVGNKSGLARTGTCKFIHRVDFNDSEPACRAMYCSKKEVPNSDRVDGQNGALPGPAEGSIHGSCVDFDGQILSQITNSSDCACFKHKSCDKCTENSNCQWCGYSNTGEGGFCYSTKTHLSICDTSVRSDRGGTCTHKKTQQGRENPPQGGWSADECNENVCVKKNYWDSLTSGDIETSGASSNYYTDRQTETACIRDNNFWDQNAIHSAPDHCILTNNKLTGSDIQNTANYEYYPHNVATDGTTVKINVADKICVPNTTPASHSALNNCTTHTTKSTCTGVQPAGTCNWIVNPLRDSLFNWSHGGDNAINFQGSGSTGTLTGSNKCPIRYNQPDPSNNQAQLSDSAPTNRNNTDTLSFKVTAGTDGYITLGQLPGGPTPIYNTAAFGAGKDYLTDCKVKKVDRRIFSNSECTTVMPSGGSTVTHYTIPHTCDDGVKYCSAETKRIDTGAAACPANALTLGLGLPPGACPYYTDQATATAAGQPTTTAAGQPADYGCVGNNVEYECNPASSNVEKYNCSKSITPDNNTQCEGTGYSVENTGGSSPLTQINGYKLNNIRFNDFITCKTNPTINADLEERRCSKIGNDLAHWGNMCAAGQDKLPKKQICELVSIYKDGPGSNDSDIASGGATWGKYVNPSNNTLEWGCYKDDGTKWTDSEICGFATAAAGKSLLSGGNITSSPASAFTPEATNKCIIDGVTSAPSLTSKYTAGATSVTSSQLENICTSGSDHDIGFKFINNQSSVTQVGSCKKLAGPTAGQEITTLTTQAQCEQNNNSWEQHYQYTAGNTCGSIGSAQLTGQPDRPTDWTGGEISTDDGIHRSECSPSIMSSCNANCNPGYGGGGEYICQYNSAGGDVCETINQKVIPNKETLCNTQPGCHFTSGQCVHDSSNFTNDGHLEWIGSPCYKIDNTAFAHGIAKLPELDSVYPPFFRAFIHSIIIIIFGGIAIYVISKSGLWLIGWGADKTLNTGFKKINGLIDYLTVDNKLFNLLSDNRMKSNEKSGIFITAVVLFVGSYFVFDYIKDYVHDALHSGPGLFTTLIRKLKHAHVAIAPPANVPIGDHAQTALSNAETQIGIAFDNASAVASDDEKMLTIVVQGGVTILVGIILLMFAMKGDDQAGILKKRLN